MTDINKHKNKYVLLLLLAAMIFMAAGVISRAEAGNTPPPIVDTLWIPIATGSDDAEENIANGIMSLKSSDLEMDQDGLERQKVGLRFPLDIPAGATILTATIQFTVDERGSDTTDLSVAGEATANALTFTKTGFDISNRTLTLATVPWLSIAPWPTKGEAGPDQQTPDLSTIVQEIMNIPGWAQGNHIAIIISGSGRRVAESFNGTAPAVLHVTFSIEPPTSEPPVAVDDDAGDQPAYTTAVNQTLIVPNGVDDPVERNDNVGFPAAEVDSFGPDTGTETSVGTLGESAENGSVVVNADGSFRYVPRADFLGLDSFVYTLMSSAGSASATVTINVIEPVDHLTTLWISVTTGSDDAEEDVSNGEMSLTSSDLEFTEDGLSEQLVGVRFQGLTIPQGATIAEAYIQYTADESGSKATTLTVYGEDSATAPTFNSTAQNISARTRTAASVPWMPAAWNTNEQTSRIQATPDLSVIVQEIVNRPDWVAGDPIAFLTVGTGRRVAESFNGTAAPVLHVSFVTEPPANLAPEAVNDGSAESPAYTTGIDQEMIVADGASDIVERNDTVGFPVAVVTTFGPLTGLESDVGTLGTSAAEGAVVVNADGSFNYTPALGYLGPDSFRYTLSNGLLPDSTATVFIEVLNIGEETPLWIPVITGSDDAEQDVTSGEMDLGSSDLEMIRDKSSIQLVGVRFQGVNIPVGAQIEEAYIQYTVDEVTTEQTILTVLGEASDNAPTFNEEAFNIANRPATTASVEWMPPVWNVKGLAGPGQRTPDLSAIVQEIVEQPDWAEGNALVIMTSGSGNRVAESFNGTAAPELHLVYSVPPLNRVPTATDVFIGNAGPLLVTEATKEAESASQGIAILSAHVGDLLTGMYTYNDLEGDQEGTSTFRWLRNGTPIIGATNISYEVAAEDEGTILSFEVTPVAATGTSPGAAVTSEGVLVEVTYAIGDTGPAGGVVIYLDDSSGLSGLEVAPVDQTAVGGSPWGCQDLAIEDADGVLIAAGKLIGTGAQNTSDIVAGCISAEMTAAELANTYSLNGINDWILPSIDELNLVFLQKAALGVASFTSTNYWSSTQKSAFSAWQQSFNSGVQRSQNRSTLRGVRAIRVFPAGAPVNIAPTATAVSITDINGVPTNVGDMLNGTYTYSDTENDGEGATTFRWLRDGTPIAGATSTSYTTVDDDLGTMLTFEVSPVATSGKLLGTAVTSAGVPVGVLTL